MESPERMFALIASALAGDTGLATCACGAEAEARSHITNGHMSVVYSCTVCTLTWAQTVGAVSR